MSQLLDLGPQSILTAAHQLRGLVERTPLERSAPLSSHTGAEVFLKHEFSQTTGSFKLRGATNALRSYSAQSSEPLRIVTCSAGNHGLGVAHAASMLQIDTTIVLPENASPAKVDALKRYPVQVIQHGPSYDEAELEALRMAREDGRRFVSPYNDPAVIAGQGTLALEVLEQLPNADLILVPVGGGGLVAGVLLWAKAVNPAIRIVGVQPQGAAVMAHSLKAGGVIAVDELPTLADGLAGSLEPDTITLPIASRLLDEMLLVTEEEISAAMRYLIHEHHIIVEGSGAVGVAALLAGKVQTIANQRVVALLTGRNVASTTLQKILG